jgi:branched-chain amino acid transport system substrate-binding protein
VEPAPISKTVFVIGLLATLAWADAPVAEAQPSIRIGATLSQTGAYASQGQVQLRGYQLCVKHLNDKGGVLGRKLELLVYDDGSDPVTAVRLYEKLITQDRVDLVIGPFGGVIADPVADVTEKHKIPMVAPVAAPTPMYRKGRKFIFSMLAPGETILEGFLDLVARKGLKTVALIYEDDLGGRAVIRGAIELAGKKGLQVVLADAFSPGTTDFTATLTRVRTANPDVLGVSGTVLDVGVAVTRQMKMLDVNPRMVGFTPGPSPAALYDVVGRDAEFVYGASTWMAELVEVRAGGLIPIARQYPGAREFVESSNKEFPGVLVSTPAYGACQVLVEGVRRAGSLDGPKVRDAISKMDYNTVFGRFRVDPDGIQIGHKYVVYQWQDGRRAIVWPEELAPGPPRFPTPPWNQRQ